MVSSLGGGGITTVHTVLKAIMRVTAVRAIAICQVPAEDPCDLHHILLTHFRDEDSEARIFHSLQ